MKEKWRRLIDDEDVVAQPMTDFASEGEDDDYAGDAASCVTLEEWRGAILDDDAGEPGDELLEAGPGQEREARRTNIAANDTDDGLAQFAHGEDELSLVEVGDEDAADQQEDCASVDDISRFLVGLQCRRGVPEKVMRDLVEYLRANGPTVADALLTKTLPSYRAMRRQAAQSQAPTVFLDILYEKDGRITKMSNLKTFPKKHLATSIVDHKYTLYHVKLKAVLALHQFLHPDCQMPDALDISVDGVPENKSAGRSVDILSVRFVGCRAIYCLAVLQPTRRGLGIEDDVVLEHFLRDLQESGLRLRRVIADAPKRALLQGLKQHSALYACPYCVAKKENGVFPSRSFGAPARTSADVRAISRRLTDDDFSSDEDRDEICMGVKKISPLITLDIDLVRDVPAEPMHLIHLGVVRKMINLTYSSGSASAKQVSFRRASDAPLNEILLRTKSLRRFSRFTRRLDTANYKAEEYRNCILAFWPAFVNTAPQDVTTCWILTVYIVRAVNLPNDALRELDEKINLERTIRLWYETFERSFGARNCTYNVHVLSHLLTIRAVAELFELSAVDYEDHYNLLKRSYRPGTVAVGTQALLNTHLSKLYGRHNCRRTKRISLMATPRVEERYVFTADRKIVKLTSIDGKSLRGLEVPVACGLFLGSGLDLNDIWCFRQGDGPEESWTSRALSVDDVVGKCVLCAGIFSVLTFEMLDC